MPNGRDGITIVPPPEGLSGLNTIGGGVGAGNVISGNAGNGLSSVQGIMLIQDNFIVTDATDTISLPNGGDGIRVTGVST